MEKPSDAELEILLGRAVDWIKEQRTHHRPSSRPFRTLERQELDPFWEATILDEIRVREVRRIEVPPEFARFLSEGLIIGITFIDTVLLTPFARVMGKSVPFHETVHVAQFEILGVEQFVASYGRSLASGLTYEQNPLERQALDLTTRYSNNPGTPFNAYEAVKTALER